MSGDDYLGGGAIQDATERARVQALIDAERQREAERAETLAHERAREQARREAERALAGGSNALPEALDVMITDPALDADGRLRVRGGAVVRAFARQL